MRIDSQLASSTRRISANRLNATMHSAECSALAAKSLHGGWAAPKPLRSSRMRFCESSPLRLHQRIACESLHRQRLVDRARQARPPCGQSSSSSCRPDFRIRRTTAAKASGVPFIECRKRAVCCARLAVPSRSMKGCRCDSSSPLICPATLALADGLEVARVRRDRAAPKLRRHRHAGLGDVADDRHAAPRLLAGGLARHLLAVHRGRVDVQGRRLTVMRRDRQLPPVGQRQGVERAPLRAVAPQPPAQGIVARQPADAEHPSSGISSRSCAAAPGCREPS